MEKYIEFNSILDKVEERISELKSHPIRAANRKREERQK